MHWFKSCVVRCPVGVVSQAAFLKAGSNVNGLRLHQSAEPHALLSEVQLHSMQA